MAVSTAPAWNTGEGWSIPEEPILDLTKEGSGPEYEFYGVVGGTVQSDGSIVVAEWRSNHVRLFSRSGSFLRQVGRQGDGPREYHTIRKLQGTQGDSLAVFSWPTKLTILAPDLTFVRTDRLPDLVRDPIVLANGEVVARRMFPVVQLYDYNEGSKLIRPDFTIERLNPTGSVEDTIWVGPGYEEYMFSVGENRGAAPPLFGRRTAYTIRDSSVIIGTSETMEFRVFDLNGMLTQIVRVPTYDLSLPDSVVEEEINARLGPDPSPFRRRLVTPMPVPQTKPAYWDLITDPEGYVWAGEAITRELLKRPRQWEVFAANGRWMGSVSTPPRFEVLEIGRDYLLGVQSDELDVEHVQLLLLNRSDNGGREDSSR